MERLTHKIVYDNEHCQYVFSYNQDSEVGTKLGELEDILEKYGIESVEELEDYLTPKLFCYAKLSENLDEFKKNYQCEPIIHIDTCEPQIELITDKVKDLEQELAKLKHKLKVADKALELAVNNISWCPAKQGECNCQEHNKDCSWFLKRKAEKELKGE